MKASDIVQALVADFETNDIAKAAELLADDFVFSGVAPQPIGKAEFLAMERAVHQAFPDWKYNQRVVEELGDRVKVVVQNTGTHSGVLDLSEMGLPVPPIAPTGTKLNMPVEPVQYYLRDGKIYEMQAAPTPGGGVPGMLQQIGVNLPTPAH
ncbi:MAG TPA: nuclear transport factor 2 family protein [Chloroflexia bacterium]|nr:nuclear transport factor 2 family protein [Chloroflexia bacterium]